MPIGVKKAFGVVAVCFALNLASPWVVSQQRTLTPGEQSMLFDGPTSHTRTLTLSKERKKLVAAVAVDGAEVDRFAIDPATRMPTATGRAGLGPLLPYEPQRKTYPLHTAGGDVALDYIGAGAVRGLETLKYRADVGECERVVDAERRTGRVVDEVFTCPGAQYRLAEASKAEAVAAARDDVAMLRGLQVMAVLTRLIGGVAFLAGLYAYARR